MTEEAGFIAYVVDGRAGIHLALTSDEHRTLCDLTPPRRFEPHKSEKPCRRCRRAYQQMVA